MAPFSHRSHVRRHWLLIFLFSCLIYGEILSPMISLYSWPYFTTGPDANETRLLLVSDPHVEGYHPSWYWFNYLCQWDGDRYLSNYFNIVMRTLKPSGFLILGDLFDRGSEATDEEFQQCYRRFERIFLSGHSLPYLLVPGDNDVDVMEGGPTSDRNVDRFVQSLGLPQSSKRVNFVQLKTRSRGSYKIPKQSDDMASGNWFIVFATHEDVINDGNPELAEVFAAEQPHLFVSGHHHRAYIFRKKFFRDQRSTSEWILSPHGPHPKHIDFDFNLSSCLRNTRIDRTQHVCDAIGLGVPSCTYRSGYPPHVGYGLLRVYANRTATYSVLRLPARTYTLYLYLICLSICLVYWIIHGLTSIARSNQNTYGAKTFKKITILP